MNDLPAQAVNSAVLNYVKSPFTAIVIIFAVLTIITAIFVAREIKKQK